eukprot:TRINITY_DN9603_c0_g1_i2.p1 TRINITY_DN9603_c0_g1~~TRINITY_DN9603_c0_g1_i2.p1  ORF type:complete len:163 (+),score=20.96 TRINITY_DN9603_c0_g1_i2:106-594(+)
MAIIYATRASVIMRHLSGIRQMSRLVQESRVATPHPVSRLRKAEPAIYEDETPSERALRKRLDADHAWHHEFWSKNNVAFKDRKRAFIDEYYTANPWIDKSSRLPAEVMARFYKSFLDEHRVQHRNYNLAWWRRSFAQLPLYAKAHLSRLFVTVYSRKTKSS